MTDDPQPIRHIWQQNEIPIIQRPSKGKLRIKLPEGYEAIYWLRRDNKHRPTWETNYFLVPASWLTHVIRLTLSRYGRVYLIQPYNEMEKCSAACQNAKGHECQCSCLGEHHGQGDGGGAWFDVSKHRKVSWKGSVLAARLLTV